MSSIEKEAIGAVNETIQSIRNAQKKNESQEHYFTLVVFNSDELRTVYDCIEASKIEELTSAQYCPSSCTPLYDAMGYALTALQNKTLRRNDKVLITIVTDGYENASVKYNSKSIKELVDFYRKKDWLFAYIGANQDAKAVGRSLGIHSTMNFHASTDGTTAMGIKMGAMIGRVAHCFSMPREMVDLQEADLFDNSLGNRDSVINDK